MAESAAEAHSNVFWFPITAGNEHIYDTFRLTPREGTRALYQIDAADKAMAIPFIKIWQVSRKSNSPINGTILSDMFTQPPQFGTSLGRAFGERPSVSIESVQVKNHMPMGWILWRDIDINIVIHRPDVLNDVSNQSRALGALLRPGNTFILRYGWTGGRNAALGPGGSHVEQRREYTKHEERVFQAWDQLVAARRAIIGVDQLPPPPPEPRFFKTIFTARTDVRFTITHYNFSILPDNQIKLTVHAKEDGMLDVSQALLTDQKEIDALWDAGHIRELWQKDPKSVNSTLIGQIVDHFQGRIDQASFSKEIEFPDPQNPQKKIKQTHRFIELQLVYDILFAQPIARALRNLGYRHVHLYFGVFQENLCKTLPTYDGGVDYGGFSIGHFQMRRDDVVRILSQVVTSGGEITVNNLMERFRAFLQGPDNNIWDMKTTGRASTSIPEPQTFVLLNPEAGYGRVQVVDRKRYLNLIGGVPGVNDQNYHKKKIEFIQNLQGILARNFIPYFSLFHQGSFFQDAKFEIVQDERMRSIFIANRNLPDRTNLIANQSGLARDADSGAAGPLLLYRSAIKGKITMIGNFVFSYAGYVWINFGVPDLNGLFYVMEKLDNVSKDGFTSTYGFQAEGSNPLGSPAQKGGPIEDVVRAKIMEFLGDPNFQVAPTAVSSPSETRQQAERDAGFLEGTLKTPVEGKTESDLVDTSNYPTK